MMLAEKKLLYILEIWNWYMGLSSNSALGISNGLSQHLELVVLVPDRSRVL